MRLIDADALKSKINLNLSGVIMQIDEAPTIEAEPVQHGRWVGLEYDGYADGFPVYDLWECSECGEEVRGEDVPDTHPYCHGCGAKMDQEAPHGEEQ